MKKYFYLIGVPLAILFLIFAFRQLTQTTIYVGYDINENGKIDEKDDSESKLEIYIPARVKHETCVDPAYTELEDHLTGILPEKEPDFDCQKLKDRRIDDMTLFEYLEEYLDEKYGIGVQLGSVGIYLENDGYYFRVYEEDGYIYIVII